MSSINRIPSGFLGWLGIKNFGRNPATLVDGLAPTWDLSRLYLEADAEYTRNVYVVSAVGYVPAITAPNNAIYWVFDVSFDIYSQAAESWAGTITRANPNNLARVQLATNRSIGASTWTAFKPDTCNIILQAGETLGLSTDAVVGTIDVVATIRYAELPV